jgi:hypothetical protein
LRSIPTHVDRKIRAIATEIAQEVRPVSIFLYGSYGTQEFVKDSDIELGVIHEGGPIFDKLQGIAARHRRDQLHVYPYREAKMRDLSLDTPFTPSIFVRLLAENGRTVWGKEIVEKLPKPEVRLLDIYREAAFCTSQALAALFFARAGRYREAKGLAIKACLFAAMALEMLDGGFHPQFKEVVDNYGGPDRELVRRAYRARGEYMEEGEILDMVFDAITYCNQVVEKRMREELEKGNRVLIP